MKRQWLFLFVFILLLCPFGKNGLLALDPLYQRNGIAFILVTDEDELDGTYDGVYQMNRTDSGSPKRLFYPKKTYGIGVNLDLNLNTFSEVKGNRWVNYTGKLEKLVNCQQTSGYYTGAAWWHRCTHQINGSTRIGGSEKHFPCEQHLHSAGTYSVLSTGYSGGAYYKRMLIPAGYWYHSVDSTNMAASPWAGGGWYTSHETIGSHHGPKWSGQRSWKMYKDSERRLYHKYHRHTWHLGDGVATPPQGAKVAESFETQITRYIRNGCFDTCGIGQGTVPLPADNWHTSMTFNRFSKSYFYARTANGSNAYLDIDAVRHMSYPVIGAMENATSEVIGVSMKNATDDYVYVLGKTVADDWLSKYYNTPVSIDFGGAAVSDQWWMKGGSIFFYDRRTGRVYQVERNEGLPSNPSDTYQAKKIEKVVIHSGLGDDIDSIAVDGFGSFYYTKTHMVPEKLDDFEFDMHDRVKWGSPSGDVSSGVVYYTQNVYKTVFKRDITGIQSEEGKLRYGANYYEQLISCSDYSKPEDLEDTDKWVAVAKPYKTGSTIGNIKRTELTVVNVATPPNVSGEKIAKLDINGPFKDGTVEDGDFTDPEDASALQPAIRYKFEIENSPMHNGKVNQRIYEDERVDEQFRRIDRYPLNDFVGGFVSTLKILGNTNSESVEYTWRIYQTVDSSNAPLEERKLMYERSNFRPYVYASFDYGEYDLEVSAKYRWYDMDKLKYGSTVASLPVILSSYTSALAFDDTSIAKMKLSVSGAMPPMNNIANLRILRNIGSVDGVGGTLKDNDIIVGIHKYFVLGVPGEGEESVWEVDNPSSSKLVRGIRGKNPPDPGDPHRIADDVRFPTIWLDPKVQVEWSTRILNPTTNAYGDYYLPPDSVQPIGSSKVQELSEVDTEDLSEADNKFTMTIGNSDDNDNWSGAFPLPSDPGIYEFRCSVKRGLQWWTRLIEWEEAPDGSLVALPGAPEERSKDIKLTGVVRVIVLDNKPPQIADATITPGFLFAETGGRINSPSIDGASPNLDAIVIEVLDDNPMAFLTTQGTLKDKEINNVELINVHSPDAKLATISYEAAISSTLNGTEEYNIPINNTGIEILPTSAGSIYRITIEKGKFYKIMPVDKAIHRIDPKNSATTPDNLDMDSLDFALTSLRDTSGNIASTTDLSGAGEILLIDTIRPNIIVSIHDEKYDHTRYALNSATSSFTFLHNEPAWTLNFQDDNDKLLEVDSPITFRLAGVDNMVASDAISFLSFKIDPTTPDTASMSIPLHRAIFRIDDGTASATYLLSAEISDTAVGLPELAGYYRDPYNSNAVYKTRKNNRKLTGLKFILHNTSLDVRVIDRRHR